MRESEEYYIRRAAEELDMARRAQHSAARRIHSELAALYLGRTSLSQTKLKLTVH